MLLRLITSLSYPWLTTGIQVHQKSIKSVCGLCDLNFFFKSETKCNMGNCIPDSCTYWGHKLSHIFLATPIVRCTLKILCLHKLVATAPFAFSFLVFAGSATYQYLHFLYVAYPLSVGSPISRVEPPGDSSVATVTATDQL